MRATHLCLLTFQNITIGNYQSPGCILMRLLLRLRLVGWVAFGVVSINMKRGEDTVNGTQPSLIIGGFIMIASCSYFDLHSGWCKGLLSIYMVYGNHSTCTSKHSVLGMQRTMILPLQHHSRTRYIGYPRVNYMYLMEVICTLLREVP